MRIVGLVPMRHVSARVPGKNYRPLARKPLYTYILSTLLGCTEIDKVVVDTDSQTIIDGVKQEFPQVEILVRPEHLRAGEIPMNEVLLHDISQVPADLYLQTHSTNPFLRTETVSRAIQSLIKNFPAYDSLFSVTRIQRRLWDELARPINHNPSILLRTQDLPPVYEENSCIYLFSRQILEQRRNRIGERPLLFEMDPIEALDIDEEQDFLLAEIIKRELPEWKQ
jgi:CMP-N-acetylneuraminic acid synthetase